MFTGGFEGYMSFQLSSNQYSRKCQYIFSESIEPHTCFIRTGKFEGVLVVVVHSNS